MSFFTELSLNLFNIKPLINSLMSLSHTLEQNNIQYKNVFVDSSVMIYLDVCNHNVYCSLFSSPEPKAHKVS